MQEVSELENTLKDPNAPKFLSYLDAPAILEESAMHRGKPVGFPTLDKMLDGVSAGELIVVTAPTGVGKSTFCQSITWNLARETKPCLWYTLEVSLPNFLMPFVKNDPGAQWEDTGKLLKVSSMPIYFPKDVEKLDFDSLKAAIRYAYLNYGVEHVFIDHLHYLLQHKDIERSGNISMYIGDRLRQLRQIALETGVSIFLVCHLTKMEEGVRPTISNMRDSSFIAQEADAVLVLWRDRLKEPITVNGFPETFSPIVHCALEKARRTGVRGMFDLGFHKGLYHELTEAERLIQYERYNLPDNISTGRVTGRAPTRENS